MQESTKIEAGEKKLIDVSNKEVTGKDRDSEEHER